MRVAINAVALVLLLGACTFKGAGDQSDGGPGTPDGPGVVTTQIVEDLAPDFTGRIAGGFVAPRGEIEPEAFTIGGVHAVGFKQAGVTDTIDLSQPPTNLGSASGETYQFALTNTWPAQPKFGQTGQPLGLNVGQVDNFSVVFDAEIFLDHDTTFTLTGDDIAVVEIGSTTTPPGPPTRLVAKVNMPATTTVMVATPGWFPLRGAMSELTGDAILSLQTDVGPALVDIPPERLRVRTTDKQGLASAWFFEEELEFGPVPLLDGAGLDLAPVTTGDIPVFAPFSLRYQGQFFIDDGGAPTRQLGVDIGSGANDHYRLFVDGAFVAGDWLGQPDVAPTSLALVPGWHTIVVDYGNDNNATSALHVTLDGTPIAADHFRPVETLSRALVGTRAACPVMTAPSICPLATLGFATGAVTDFVDVEYTLGASSRDIDATIDVGGVADPIAIHATPNETETGQPYDYDAFHTKVAGVSGEATWSVGVVENAPGQQTTFSMIGVASTHGGTIGTPFSSTLAYESIAYTLLPNATLGTATVALVPADPALVIEWRTADDDAALATAAYTAVANGASIGAPGGKLLQFRVTSKTDGWTYRAIDRIEIDYTTPPSAPTP